MNILLATENTHKLDEFSQIFDAHEVMMPADADIDFSFEETGTTYLENAFGKASHLYSLAKRPVLADDSGLSVVALDGAPGIYSARYGSTIQGEKLGAEERNQLLLENLEGESNREAFFVCCLVLMLDEYRFFVSQETVSGQIGSNPIGAGGFGYDPVFNIPELGKTVAELTDQQKHAISHRGRAASHILRIINGM